MSKQFVFKIEVQYYLQIFEMQELDLKEIMPLFSPVYDPDFLQNDQRLAKAIKEQIFDRSNNQIAEDILREDPSNYNAWYLKKMYILSHKTEEVLQSQAKFVDSCLEEKVKGFQIWEQKRFLTELGCDWKSELVKVQKILLERDQKNYHAWSFRAWLTNFSHIHSEELIFAEKMIKKDAYNNSAWTHLYFALQTVVNSTEDQNLKRTLLARYISLSIDSLKVHQNNRACWNFLRGMFPSIKLKNFASKNTLKPILIKSFDEFPEISKFCESEWQRLNETELKNKEESVLMAEREILATLAHIYSQKEQMLEYAKNICQELKVKEPQRVHYWAWIELNL